MLKIAIKTEAQVTSMRQGGKLLNQFLYTLKDMAKEGMDVWELEEKFLDLCHEHMVDPSCKGYSPMGFPPFPCGLCFSINEESVHCYPEKGRKLKNGDKVTLDTVIEHQGMFVDKAISFGIGTLDKQAQKLVDTTKETLEKAISVVKPGINIGLISNTMQKNAQKNGYSVLTEYAGHGIGKQMHEFPDIPCYGNIHDGPIIQSGMTLAIEALLCEKGNKLIHHNFWQTKTADNGYFVQWEDTVLVTDSGYEILTR